MQEPDFTQSFNRYAYVWNNPLRYTDPSGEIVFTIIGALLAPVTGGASLAIGIAMDVGGTINLVTKALQPGKINSFVDVLAAYGIGAAAGAIVGASSFITGGAVVNAFNVGGIFTGAVVGGLTGAAVGGVGGGLSSWAMGGDFWDGAKHGALLGGISGAFSGGFAGYAIAQAKGLNYWWGNEVKYGRNQWSFFTSEKPYYVVKWDVSNVGSKSLNDCVPTSFAEANDYFGGNTSYDDYLTRTGYIDDVGVRLVNDPNRYRDFVSEHFNTIPLGADGLTDERIVRDIKNAGGLIHTNMPHRGIRHADNLRSISYFHSGKVVMKFRIGSFRFSSGNYNWWFYILTGVK